MTVKASERGTFSSKMGIILASAGSAVGLGNVWRFPTEVGNSGGAAFILIYIACVVLLGLPLMVAEFTVGRHTHANTVDAYRRLAPGTPWVAQGYLGVFTSWFILCYYSVVAGWTLKYLVASALAGPAGISGNTAYFESFTASPVEPIAYMVAVMAVCHVVIARGVEKGIERSSKLLMPLLLLIIAMLVVCSFSMPGSEAGLRFLLQPDFSCLTSDVVLSAMGQSFFSLSIAMGCLCTYASYFRDDARLMRTAVSVASIDTTVAVMSGFIIFPAVFSVADVEVSAGPGLVFITLPNVFRMAFASVPWLGWLFAMLFYMLLLLAALTSMMSIHEPTTAFLLEHFRWPRRVATRVVTLSCVAVGSLCSLSFGVLSGLRVGGLTLFELFDFISAKIFLPVGGLIIALFVGWRLPRRVVWEQATNGGTLRTRTFGLYMLLLRWVAPIAIVLIFCNELGLL